ncbi:MAG: hypothetical protein WAS51_01010 [Ilumatobacteraceae bacterium]
MNPIPRPLASSVDELLAGTRRLGEHQPASSRSGAHFEQLELDGERCVVKYVHPDSDFTMRVSGDIGCRSRRVWALGMMDVAADVVDHATIGAAPWGRNGWGVALLMRDVSAQLVPADEEPLPEEHHLRFVDHCTAMAARTWGWHDDFDLLPHRLRWQWFGRGQLEGERQLGFPEPVPRIAVEGWQRFAERVPAPLGAAVEELRTDATPLSEALLTTPQTFLDGDWKLSNLGIGDDGRTILLDWAYPGEGPICHELGWYLALNRARLPAGHTKESTITDFEAALRRHGVETDAWFARQLDLCMLGALVQFGWEKALGDDEELGWWCTAASAGLERL